MRAPAPRRDEPTPSAPAEAPLDPAPQAVAVFAQTYAELTRDRPDAPLIVGVSGGPDSVALLLLAHAALGARVSAVTVDHGLRPDSAAEAEHVATLCARRGIVHRTLMPSRHAMARGNLQDAARRARYALLGVVAAETGAFVATAHHADDQLETMVMRLRRGSGVAGLAGIRARAGFVVRPLLGWRRVELAGILAACGETAIDDPSNRDDRFDRARLRKRLDEVDWLDAQAVVRSAAALDQANAAIEWAVDEAWSRYASIAEDERVTLDGATMRDDGLPHEIKRRLVRRALSRVDAACAPREALLARAFVALQAGRAITIGHVLVRPGKAHWIFGPAPTPRRVHTPFITK